MTAIRRADDSGRSVARRMTAVEQLRAEKKVRRTAQLLLGLAGYGVSITLLVESALGASSWNILAEGVALRSGLSFGWATNIIAVVVLLFWIPLRELPGLGTVLNVVVVGAAADLAAAVLPTPSALPQQLLCYVVGLVMLTWFDAVYLGARFGPGPRDGLMTGAVRVSGKPIWMVRTGIEVVVLVIGWMLGGTVGLGTVLIAVAMGPLVQQFLRVTTVRLAGDHEGERTIPGSSGQR
ncbi:membrane protein YczE [Nocardia sp. NPDC003963]